MPVFQYLATDIQGKEHSGTLEGDSAKQIRQVLRDRGYIPIKITPVTTHAEKGAQTFRRGISQGTLANLTREFSSLIGAGMPIDEGLAALSEQTETHRLKQIILAVRAKVLEGFPLAKSLGEFPHIFPEIYRHSIAAGEASGHLAEVLAQLADYTERSQQIRQKIQQALIYPLLMTITSLAVITFLLAIVVPKMIAVFEDQGQQLPLPTKILLALSNGLQHYGWLILIVIIALSYGFYYALRYPHFKQRWHQFKLRLPLFKHAIHTLNTARYAQTLGMLVAAGIPIIEAMKISQSMMTNVSLQAAVAQATILVQEGTPIHRALKQTRVFAPVMIHYIANGEQSGRLEEMLTRAAQQQDRQVTTLIDTGLTIFEPVLILVMGAVVLFIVLAILLPMFEMSQMVG